MTVTTAADVLDGNMLGVHTTVKVIGLTSPAAVEEDELHISERLLPIIVIMLNIRVIVMLRFYHYKCQILNYQTCTKYNILSKFFLVPLEDYSKIVVYYCIYPYHCVLI